MNKVFDYFAPHFGLLLSFVPFLCLAAWFAIESRWEAYSRKRNYQELTILDELRQKSIITQQEFDERKEELLST
jgi:hypothetical protein